VIVDRLITLAVMRGERRRRNRAVATFSSVCAFAGMSTLALYLWVLPVGTDASVVVVSAGVVHPVRVVYDSGADRPDAQVSVTLGPNIELANRPGMREMTWNAPLEKGRNLLELPIKLTGSDEARLDVEFSSVAGLKRIQVVVRAAAATLKEVRVNAVELSRSMS